VPDYSMLPMVPVRDGHFANYLIVSNLDGQSQLFDLSGLSVVAQIDLGGAPAADAIEGPSGRLFIASGAGRISFIISGQPADELIIDLDLPPRQMAISSNAKYLAVLIADGSIVLIDIAERKKIVRLVEFIDGKWAVVAPDGRYDASDPGDMPGLSWVLAVEPFTPRPIEIFYKEFYEPRLLPRLLAGENFPAITRPENINRLQPLVSIKQVEPDPANASRVSVTVEVQRSQKQVAQNGKTIAEESGVFDVKLFRNSRLVGVFPEAGGEVLTDKSTGKKSIVFKSIRLPTQKDEHPLEFSAYAFNRHGIKSETARFAFTSAVAAGKRKSRAYIVTIGVNSHDNPSWDLRYAANDARAMNRLLTQGLKSQSHYDEIVPILLISDNTAGGKPNGAVKSNIETLLNAFAGKKVDPGIVKDFQEEKMLGPIGPDDFLLISFSGHGYADRNGRFHLFPSDIGQNKTREITPELLRHTITSDDLYRCW
jgi:hypothetical protein